MANQYTKKTDRKIVITAIITLGIVQVAAMFFGINGTVRTIIFTMIGTLAGLSMPIPKILKGGRKT